jgi:CheY-like chemotaxis protein
MTKPMHLTSQAPQKKVLLVDDSKTSLMMSELALRSVDCAVVVAHDGLEAVEKAVLHRPDLIVMDVEMPRLDGFEACRRLRAVLGKRLPILLLTTRSSVEFVRRGFESGCTGYLSKPISTQDLLSKVRAFLGS